MFTFTFNLYVCSYNDIYDQPQNASVRYLSFRMRKVYKLQLGATSIAATLESWHEIHDQTLFIISGFVRATIILMSRAYQAVVVVARRERAFFALLVGRDTVKCAPCAVSLLASRECRANSRARIVWWAVRAIILNHFASAVLCALRDVRT